jgi:hypothetical protein
MYVSASLSVAFITLPPAIFALQPVHQIILMQHPTRLKGTFVPNEDYFFKQHLFHIISNLIFILLYFTWVSTYKITPLVGLVMAEESLLGAMVNCEIMICQEYIPSWPC